eukprot:COSAG02_NODE_16_length_56207_cov_9.816122_33_plen_224_part_00
MLGRAVPLESIEQLCRRADEVLLGDVEYPGMTFQLCPSAVDKAEEWSALHEAGGVHAAVAKVRTKKYRKVQGWERDSSFLDYMQLPLFRDATRKIIESDRISVFRSMFFNKPAAEPGVSDGGVVINWHQVVTHSPSLSSCVLSPELCGGARPYIQDGNTNGGWNLSIDPRLTIWTALDPTSAENGCVRVYSGDSTDCIACCADHTLLSRVIVSGLEQHCRPNH